MTLRTPALGLTAALAFAAAAWPNDGKPADGLPPGAICRIGSASFRHGGPVSHLAYSRDGKTLYSACPTDKRARAWDAATGREVRVFGPDAGVDAVCPLGDGKRVATADDRKSVRLWDAASGKELKRLREPEDVPGAAQRILLLGNSGRQHDLAASADGKTLASLYVADNAIIVWDVAAEAERVTIPGTQAGFRAIDVTADGKSVLAGTGKGGVAFYDSATAQPGQSYAGFSESIQAVAVSPDGRYVAALAQEQGLRVWDAAGKEVHRDAKPFDGSALAFAPDGKLLAYGFADKDGGNMLRWIDPASGKDVGSVGGLLEKIEAVEFAPDGKTLAAAGTGNTVRFYDAETGKLRDMQAGHGGAITTIGISPDGKFVITCSVNDNAVRLWDAQSGRELRRLDGNEAGIDEVQYSPDGRFVASATKEKPVYIWEAATGKLVRTIADHPSIGTHIRFSPDGNRIVTGGTGKVVAVWEVATGKLLHEYATPVTGISSIVTFDEASIWAVEDKSQVEDEADARSIGLFDLVAGKPVRRFHGNEKSVSGIAVSADRKSAASSGKDGVIRVYEVATGAERLRFSDDGEQNSWTGTQFVAFSPDGRTLATCGTSNPVARRWDLVAGTPLPPLTGHAGMVGAVDVSSDGRRLITGSQDTTCIVWDAAALRPAAKNPPGAANGLAQHWDALRDRDAAKAYRAMWGLVEGGAASVALVREQLKPGKPADLEQIARWIRDLDAPQYTVRERATASLVGMLDQAEGALRQVLATTRSAEVRQRARLILDWPRLRDVRAVEMLEALGSPEARLLLDELSRGPDGSLLTQESKAALRRLALRTGAARG